MHGGACSCEPVATVGVEPERVGSASAGCVVACGRLRCDPWAGWRSSCDLVPGGCVDPSVDGVTTGPCWSAAVTVRRVLVEGESASPADSGGVGVGELADGGRAGVKRAGMVARFHALSGAMPQGWGRVESLRRGQGHRPRSSGSPRLAQVRVPPGGAGGRIRIAGSWRCRRGRKIGAPSPVVAFMAAVHGHAGPSFGLTARRCVYADRSLVAGSSVGVGGRHRNDCWPLGVIPNESIQRRSSVARTNSPRSTCS